MPKYTTQDKGYESGYESDGGTSYKPEKEIGKGKYTRARKFKSTGSSTAKEIAVLDPVLVDWDEAQAKYNFFKALYPDRSVELIKTPKSRAFPQGGYRLILPLIPGQLYKDLKISNDPEEHLGLFLSAVEALERCHNAGYIVVDLTGSNVHYDADTNITYLIDGGLSAKKGAAINHIFQPPDQAAVLRAKGKFKFYAPECFSLTPMKATAAMDVYALGYMMQIALQDHNPSPAIVNLYTACQNQDPTRRPTLATVKNSLLSQAKVVSKPQSEQTSVLEEFKTLCNMHLDSSTPKGYFFNLFDSAHEPAKKKLKLALNDDSATSETIKEALIVYYAEISRRSLFVGNFSCRHKNIFEKLMVNLGVLESLEDKDNLVEKLDDLDIDSLDVLRSEHDFILH